MNEQVKWLAGWYATRLHAFRGVLGRGPSLCGAYVYEEPQTQFAKRRADGGLPKCKRCENLLIKEAVMARTKSEEFILYEQLQKALSAIRTPMGHNSGAFEMIVALIDEHCPKVRDEQAAKSQQTWSDGSTYGT